MTRVPYAGDEKTSRSASLDRHRDASLWKLDGLDDEALRRPMVPSGTSLLGLVKHLAGGEYGWFCDAVTLRWIGDHRRGEPGEAIPGRPGS